MQHCDFCGSTAATGARLVGSRLVGASVCICGACVRTIAAELDAQGSFTFAIAELRSRHIAGEAIPRTGYFAESGQT